MVHDGIIDIYKNTLKNKAKLSADNGQSSSGAKWVTVYISWFEKIEKGAFTRNTMAGDGRKLAKRRKIAIKFRKDIDEIKRTNMI